MDKQKKSDNKRVEKKEEILKKRIIRDVPAPPSSEEIERSINRGRSRPLSDFRKEIGWS
jgi:hypothetical protein